MIRMLCATLLVLATSCAVAAQTTAPDPNTPVAAPAPVVEPDKLASEKMTDVVTNPMAPPAAASTPEPVTYDWVTLLTPLIVILMPIAVHGIKQAPVLQVPENKKWIPVIGVALTVLISVLTVMLTDSRIGGVWTIIIGLAVVGAREVYSQWMGAEAAKHSKTA